MADQHNGHQSPNPTPPPTANTPTGQPSSAGNLSAPPGRPLRALADEILVRLVAARERIAAERAAFTGACFDCRDTGWVAGLGPQGREPCSKCARGAALLADETLKHQAAARAQLFRAAGVPSRRWGHTLDTYPDQGAQSLACLRAFASEWDGKRGLLLIGSFGTGKTGLLIGLLHAVADRYLPRYGETPAPAGYPYERKLAFVTTTDLLDALRTGYETGAFAALMERMRGVRLLVLDDLGAEKPSEWAQERLYGIVNHRYEYELPTFASSNYGLDQLAERIGPRVLERLLEVGDVVQVTGENLRMR